MKTILLTLSLLISTQLFASNDALVAKNFEGRYELVKAKKEGARWNCLKETQVYVTANAVYIDTDMGGFSFIGDDECTSKEGDIGPLEVQCTSYSKNKLTYSNTNPITAIGYLRETRSASLSKDGQTLTLKKDNTAIPAGITRLWQDEKFTCVYKKIN